MNTPKRDLKKLENLKTKIKRKIGKTSEGTKTAII